MSIQITPTKLIFNRQSEPFEVVFPSLTLANVVIKDLLNIVPKFQRIIDYLPYNHESVEVNSMNTFEINQALSQYLSHPEYQDVPLTPESATILHILNDNLAGGNATLTVKQL